MYYTFTISGICNHSDYKDGQSPFDENDSIYQDIYNGNIKYIRLYKLYDTDSPDKFFAGELVILLHEPWTLKQMRDRLLHYLPSDIHHEDPKYYFFHHINYTSALEGKRQYKLSIEHYRNRRCPFPLIWEKEIIRSNTKSAAKSDKIT